MHLFTCVLVSAVTARRAAVQWGSLPSLLQTAQSSGKQHHPTAYSTFSSLLLRRNKKCAKIDSNSSVLCLLSRSFYSSPQYFSCLPFCHPAPSTNIYTHAYMNTHTYLICKIELDSLCLSLTFIFNLCFCLMELFFLTKQPSVHTQTHTYIHTLVCSHIHRAPSVHSPVGHLQIITG